MSDAILCFLKRVFGALLADIIGGILIHITLPHKRALPQSMTRICEDLGSIDVSRTVIRSRCDALAQKIRDSVFVRSGSVIRIRETGFDRKCDAVEPVEDMEALAETAHRPLRGVVVGVDEAGDEE